VFLTTHYMEEAEVLANKVAIIDKGKISAIGSPEELISKYGGLKVLTIKNGDKKLASTLNEKFGQSSLSNNGDVNVQVDNVDELWRVMAVLTEMKIGKDIEIQTPTMDDVFLKITGGRITDEGELKQ
jgi:ABC-2 type transport system ATP-binding protein